MKKLSEILGIETEVEFNEKAHTEEAPVDPIQDWITKLCKNLFLAKGVKTDENRIKFLVEKLEADDYPDYKRTSAEYWILRGNWSYGKKDLTLDDFYPTAKMMDTFENEFFTVGAFEDLYVKLRDMFKNRFEGSIKALRSEYEEKVLDLELKNRNRNAMKNIVELFKQKSRADRLQDENEKLKLKCENLNIMLDEVTVRVNNLIKEQNELILSQNLAKIHKNVGDPDDFEG